MKVKRLLINALGFLFLGIGAVGVIVPLLPTTPFVLLAAVLFSYSNRKFHDWLKHSPFFGAYITNFEEKQGVPMSLKIKSIIFVWVSLSISMVALRTLWAFILLSVIGAGVTVHLLMIRTKRQKANERVIGKMIH